MILNLSARDRHTKVPGQPSPAGHLIHIWLWLLPLPPKFWKQKRRGSMYLSALIPTVRPSHCPLMRISNESLPTPAIIYTHTTAMVIPGYTYPRNPPLGYIRKERAPLKGVHLIIYIKGNDSRREI